MSQRSFQKNLTKPKTNQNDPSVLKLYQQLKAIQTSSYPLAVRLKIFAKYCLGGVELEDWQIQDLCLIITHKESAVCWSRRIGKTFCMSILAIWFAVQGQHGLFLVAGMDQLVQPKIYWSSMAIVTNVTEEWIYVAYQPMIHLNCMTDKNARSSGNYWVIFDEEAAIDSNKQYLVHVASITVRNYQDSHIVHVSTAKRGTTFEENFFRLESLKATSYHPYTDVQGRYIDKEKILDDKNIMPQWLWEQEYLCKWVASGGSVFHNLVEYAINPSHIPNMVGIDWNKSGHTLVYLYRHDEDNTIYVLKEEWIDPDQHQLGLNFDYLESITKQWPFCKIYVEDGGYNEAWAIEASSKFGCIKVQPKPMDKSLRLMEALKYQIKVDPKTSPFLWKELRSAGWDLHKMTYLKDITHTCHYLDAFMNCCVPFVSQSVFTSIPGPGLSQQSGNREEYLIKKYHQDKQRRFF